MTHKWFRVSKSNPCTVCGKTDWDTFCPDLKLSCCMRVPSNRPAKNGGYFHPLDAKLAAIPILPKVERPTINATAIMREFRMETTRTMLDALAVNLHVEASALLRIGAAWAQPHNAWAFPMKDEYGNVIGIRLRSASGKKWAVTGSKAGLFYSSIDPDSCPCVCEGPTDASAALSIGLEAVGRPSCAGQENMIAALLRKAKRVLIISDNDDPGLQGAERLQRLLGCSSLIYCPPCKDLREFVAHGGTRELIQAMTRPLIWKQPNPSVS